MTGALLQLVAIGSQDLYFIGNPQISFFKSVFKSHTNFSMESINIYFDGNDKLNYNNFTKLYVKIPKHAQLMSHIFLEFKLPAIYSKYDNNSGFKWIKNIGTNLIDKIKFFIGGKLIEEITGEFIEIYYNYYLKNNKKKNFNEMIGNKDIIYNPYRKEEELYPVYNNDELYNNNNRLYLNRNYNTIPTIEEQNIMVPIPLWFTKDIGLSLPLMSIQSDITIELELKPINKLYTVLKQETIDLNISTQKFIGETITNIVQNNTLLTNINIKPNISIHEIKNFTKLIDNTWNLQPRLNINYIFMDYNEKEIAIKSNSRYLIEKTIKMDYLGLNNTKIFNPEFFHLTKEIYIVPKRNDFDEINQFSNYTNLDDVELDPNYNQTYYYNICYKQAEYDYNQFKGLNQNYEKMLKSDKKLYDGDNNLLNKKDYEPKLPNTNPIKYLGRFRTDELKTIDVIIKQNSFGTIMLTINNNVYPIINEDEDKFVLQNETYSNNSILSENLLISKSNALTNLEIQNFVNNWNFRNYTKIPSINKENYKFFSENIIDNIEIKFNGDIRLASKNYNYFNKIEPFKYYNNFKKGICLYTFSLNPHEYQPSGACNFTTIESVEFEINFKNALDNESYLKNDYNYDLSFYNITYNQLKIDSGNATLIYSV
jgi:hypothetical protein